MAGEELQNEDNTTREQHSLDELAKGLANGSVTRGRALKLMGAALLGVVSLGLFGGVAQAQPLTCEERCEQAFLRCRRDLPDKVCRDRWRECFSRCRRR